MAQTTDTPIVPVPGPVADGSEQLVGRFREYVEAQRAVDALSDAGFPVGSVRIVGRDVAIVEQVTGRLTKARATALGAASGAWFGLFIGLLMGLFAVGGLVTLLLVGLVIGAFWGAVFGFVGHAATGGRRDFSSVRGLAAGSYDVLTDAGLGERARAVLSSSTLA